MSAGTRAFTPARSRALRWLTDPRPRVPGSIAAELLGELFASPQSVLMCVLNGLLLNVLALVMCGGVVFFGFLLADVALAVARMQLVRRASRASAEGRPTPTDLHLLVAMAWCALHGAVAFTAMTSGNHTLQVLAAVTVTALIGPLCARNFPAPRLALAMVLLCDVPFLAGAVLSGDKWLLALLVQTPIYVTGCMAIGARFQAMSVAILWARRDSQHLARHDSLTGLLNRFGLLELLTREFAAPQRNCVLFYLDLDGFKQVNDTHGHPAGDKLLQLVARQLRLATRAGDIVARLGGDEFVVAAPDLPPAQADGYAGSLIERLSHHPLVLDGVGEVRVGVSVGFACAPHDATTVPELQRKADLALYQAKQAGKSRYRRYAERRPASPVRQPSYTLA